MFIGQDPTIRKRQERVRMALMLDDENSQIKRWIKNIFGNELLIKSKILGTNLVKCVLKEVPTNDGVGGIDYLIAPFNHCKEHLIKEFNTFKPDYVFTLGEPCHQLFYSLIKNIDNPKKQKMSEYFNGELHELKYNEINFKYSPLLHIQTYRVAQKYGDIVKKFENEIKKIR